VWQHMLVHENPTLDVKEEKKKSWVRTAGKGGDTVRKTKKTSEAKKRKP